MNIISNIFFLVHQDYDRLGHVLGDEGRYFWYVDPQSHELYSAAKIRQAQIVNEIKNDEHSALFVLPYAISLLRWYHVLPIQERNALEAYLTEIAELHQKLGDRFILLGEHHFEDRKIKRKHLFRKDEEVYRAELTNPNFRQELPFVYSPDNTTVHAFGEAIHGCVNDYGRALCRSLGISETRFTIIREASIQQLLHEDENQFYTNLGWRK